MGRPPPTRVAGRSRPPTGNPKTIPEPPRREQPESALLSRPPARGAPYLFHRSSPLRASQNHVLGALVLLVRMRLLHAPASVAPQSLEAGIVPEHLRELVHRRSDARGACEGGGRVRSVHVFSSSARGAPPRVHSCMAAPQELFKGPGSGTKRERAYPYVGSCNKAELPGVYENDADARRDLPRFRLWLELLCPDTPSRCSVRTCPPCSPC